MPIIIHSLRQVLQQSVLHSFSLRLPLSLSPLRAPLRGLLALISLDLYNANEAVNNNNRVLLQARG